ncbi:hypothetical protein CLF_110585, partial [Clonorchis sinensis]
GDYPGYVLQPVGAQAENTGARQKLLPFKFSLLALQKADYEVRHTDNETNAEMFSEPRFCNTFFGENLFDLEYAEVVLIFEKEDKAQMILDELIKAIPFFETPMASERYIPEYQAPCVSGFISSIYFAASNNTHVCRILLSNQQCTHGSLINTSETDLATIQFAFITVRLQLRRRHRSGTVDNGIY